MCILSQMSRCCRCVFFHRCCRSEFCHRCHRCCRCVFCHRCCRCVFCTRVYFATVHWECIGVMGRLSQTRRRSATNCCSRKKLADKLHCCSTEERGRECHQLEDFNLPSYGIVFPTFTLHFLAFTSTFLALFTIRAPVGANKEEGQRFGINIFQVLAQTVDYLKWKKTWM